MQLEELPCHSVLTIALCYGKTLDVCTKLLFQRSLPHPAQEHVYIPIVYLNLSPLKT